MPPGGIYLFKVNNRNTRTRCEICSKLTIKTTVSSLLTLNIFHLLFTRTIETLVSIVNFKHVIADSVKVKH